MANEPIVVANPAACTNCTGDRQCEASCSQGAISHDETGRLVIDYNRCLGEGDCVTACSFGALSEKSQFVPLIDLLRQKSQTCLCFNSTCLCWSNLAQMSRQANYEPPYSVLALRM